jgi:hypothetical protein
MATTIDLTLSVPESEFPNRFKSIESVSKIMKLMQASYAAYWKDIFDYLEEQPTDQLSHEKDKKEIEMLEEHILHLEENRKNATNDELVIKYSADLNKARTERDKIVNRLTKRDEMDVLAEQLKLQKYRACAEAIDVWVEKLGNWFASGALGAGTVTYRDKTYTAE